MMYPLVSRLYYRIESSQQIASFDKEKKLLSDEEISRRMKLAEAFNDSLINSKVEDPYTKEEHQKGIKEYARMLEIQEKIGHVEIPSIDADIPIYAGTNEDVLQIGAGHLEGTSLPIGGVGNHTVITAHSGLPTATLFSKLHNVKIGDKFYIHNIKEILAYQVDNIEVIEPDNFEGLLPVEGHDYATLLTCTPIMINSHRLIVRGHRVEYVPAVEERIIQENKAAFMYRYLFYASLVLILILLYIIYRLRKRKKAIEKEKKLIVENSKKIIEKDDAIKDENLDIVNVENTSKNTELDEEGNDEEKI